MNSASLLLQQIPYILPLLVVCVAGVVLSLVNIKRCPLSAGLTLASCVLLILVSLAFPVIQSLAIASGNQPGGDFERVGKIMQIVGFASSLLRTIAVGMLLAAVFTGRRDPA